MLLSAPRASQSAATAGSGREEGTSTPVRAPGGLRGRGTAPRPARDPRERAAPEQPHQQQHPLPSSISFSPRPRSSPPPPIAPVLTLASIFSPSHPSPKHPLPRSVPASPQFSPSPSSNSHPLPHPLSSPQIPLFSLPPPSHPCTPGAGRVARPRKPQKSGRSGAARHMPAEPRKQTRRRRCIMLVTGSANGSDATQNQGQEAGAGAAPGAHRGAPPQSADGRGTGGPQRAHQSGDPRARRARAADDRALAGRRLELGADRPGARQPVRSPRPARRLPARLVARQRGVFESRGGIERRCATRRSPSTKGGPECPSPRSPFRF